MTVTVRQGCVLQENALDIRVSGQIERLDELINAEGAGTAFFERTHITHGMRDLISTRGRRVSPASRHRPCSANRMSPGARRFIVNIIEILSNGSYLAYDVNVKR